MWPRNDTDNRIRYAAEIDVVDANSSGSAHVLNSNVKLVPALDTTTRSLSQYSLLDNDRGDYATSNGTRSRSLFYVNSSGVYSVSSGVVVIERDFGDVFNVVVTRAGDLYVLSGDRGQMFKYNRSRNEMTRCAYPVGADYVTIVDLYATFNELADGNLIIIGGGAVTGSSTSEVMTYNPVSDHWSSVASLPYDVVNHATAVNGRDVYVTGGGSTGCVSGDGCEVARLRGGAWRLVTPLDDDRRRHLAVADDDVITVIGGTGGDGKLRNDVACYDVRLDYWYTIGTRAFRHVTHRNSVYCDRKRAVLTYREGRVYSTSLDTFARTVLCSDAAYFEARVSCLILM